MNTSSSLQAIADKVAQSGRVGFADVRRLGRDVLANGIGSRAEAELLIRSDRGLRRRDPAWAELLVVALVDFVVWAERPTGTVDEGTARWLAGVLEGAAPRTARLIVQEIAREANAFENDALQALAAIGRSSARRSRPVAGTVPADAACRAAA